MLYSWSIGGIGGVASNMLPDQFVMVRLMGVLKV